MKQLGETDLAGHQSKITEECFVSLYMIGASPCPDHCRAVVPPSCKLPPRKPLHPIRQVLVSPLPFHTRADVQVEVGKLSIQRINYVFVWKTRLHHDLILHQAMITSLRAEIQAKARMVLQ